MTVQAPVADTRLIYPESDGQPIADNTKQFRWIVTIKEGLEALFADNPDVFVAGDLLWYPVEGRPDIRAAPDVLVAFGRAKGDRGSYLQWQEQGIPPRWCSKSCRRATPRPRSPASSASTSGTESKSTTYMIQTAAS